MGIAQQLRFDEWCPVCGEGVDKLNPFTGFCAECSVTTNGRKVCESCGNDFLPSQNSRTMCSFCRNAEWLGRNADAIERVMVHYSITAVESIQKIYDDNRPRCAMCGDKIKHGKSGKSIFCTKKDPCRRAAIRYHHYRVRNNMNDDEALERALHGTSKSNKA